MAKERMVNTRLWNDNWVSKLDPIEKLLFVYFLTNDHTNISGIYELPLKVAAIETGIDPTMIEKIMPRLVPKIKYFEGWIIMTNFPKYQHLQSGSVVEGIIRELGSAPESVQIEAVGGGWGDGLGIIPYTKPNLTKLITADAAKKVELSEGEDITRVATDSSGEEATPRYKRKLPDQNARFIMEAREQKQGRKFTNPMKQMGAIAQMLRKGYTSGQIQDEFDWLEKQQFWKEKGVDFLIVLSQIHKEKIV